MKIFSVEQIRAADTYTIEHEPIKSIDLMERATNACTEWIINNIDLSNPVVVFCGQGNNGGDGLAIARKLKKALPNLNLRVFLIPQKNGSLDFQENLRRIQKETSVEIALLQENDSIELFPENTVLIDAILGSGLTKPLDGYLKNLVLQINELHLETVLSIDVPTGLFCDELPKETFEAIHASHTLTFEFPKLSFLMKESFPYVGEFVILPIGIHKEYIQNTSTSEYLIDPEMVKKMFRKRNKFSHKGNFGHALLVAGSYGKMGAAVLASKACLRSGVGLLTTHIPAKGVDILQVSVPEAMLSIDSYDFYFETALFDFSKYTAVGVGPAIGALDATKEAFAALLGNCSKPMVLDADALNILSKNKFLLGKIPENTILTPHVGEFERLLGKTNLSGFEQWEAQKRFAEEYNVIVVLKGAHTCVCLPSGESFFNNNGNPGMSTAGSGDVLTGIITSFLAQGYAPWQAAVMGVFVHGQAGDKAVEKSSQHAMVAGDVIENL